MRRRPHMSRDKLFKVTTQFRVDEDLCHSVHFIWAADEAHADRLIEAYAHHYEVLDHDVYDVFKPAANEAWHQPANGTGKQGNRHKPKRKPVTQEQKETAI